MSESGQFNRLGLPRPLAGARLTLDFADAGHATGVPPWLQQRVARAVLGCAGAARRLRSALGLARLWRPYAFVDEWDVAAAPEAVYAALADGRTYPLWWRPVYIDVKADGPAVVGSVSHQHFKGRLPYHLHTSTRLVRLDPDRLIEAAVDGDLRGRGIWTLTPVPTGTHIRFDWTVNADRRLLRVLTPLLRPAFRANHNWAISRAIDGLEPYLRSNASSASGGM
jgi:uncharacterized protein YndB with AHSA1/START domain